MKGHLAQALGHAAIQQGHRVHFREAHLLLEELTDATLDGTRKLPPTAAVTALLDRPLHHAHELISGPRSWRTALQTPTDSSVTVSR